MDLNGTDGGESITGTENDDRIYAGGGDDLVEAGDGADEVYGGAGSDDLYGGAGNDYLESGEEDQSSSDHDFFYGGDGDDYIQVYGTAATVDAGAGDDIIDKDDAAIVADGGSGDDSFEDVLGDGFADTLTGGEGRDTYELSYVQEGMVADTITDFASGDGGDILDIHDMLEEFTNYRYGDNPFHDGHLQFVADGGDVSLQVRVDGSGDWSDVVRLQGVSIDAIATSNLFPDFARNDVFITTSIDTGDGDDVVYGSAQDDTITVAGGDDIVIAQFGNDTVYGGDGTDRIDGSDGADTLYGGEGSDIFGDEPADGDGTNTRATLAAGPPSTDAQVDTGVSLADYRNSYLHGDFADGDVDTIYGGAGADVYHLAPPGQFGEIVDVIADFDVAEDVITLGNIRNAGYFSGDQSPFLTGAMQLVQDGGDTLVQLGGVSLVRLVGVEVSTLTAANFDGVSPTGIGETIEGTDGPDALTGTAADDTISGFDGGDTLDGQGGADALYGGTGGDTIYGGAGGDVIEGGVGDDRLDGGDGDDTIYGGDAGVYVPVSDNGLPAYFGALDAALANGLGGSAGFGEESVGRNDDGYFNLTFPAGFGGDAWTVDGQPVGSIGVSNNGFGALGGLQFNIFPRDLDTRAGAVTPSAGGNSTGSNLLWYDFDSASNTITLTYDDVGQYSYGTSPSAFQVQIRAVGGGDFDVVFRYESIGYAFPGNASVSYAGNTYALPVASGQDPANTVGDLGVPGVWAIQIRGGQIIADSDHGDGNDTIDGGAGNDGLYGGTGDDQFDDRQGADTFDGGEGADRFLYVGYGDGADTYTGGVGRDTYDYRGYQYSAVPVLVTVTDFATGDAGDVFGLANIGALANRNGNENPFASGHLRLVQDGADTLLVGDYDGVDGAAAATTVVRFLNTSATAFTATNFGGFAPVPIENQIVTGTDAPETLYGGAGDDTITGLGGNDTLYGAAGADTIDGGADDDQIYGGTGTDILTGGEGVDTLFGDAGADRLDGGAGYNYLYGGEGDDTLSDTGGDGGYFDGGAGADVLTGGGAGETLYGGGGDDRIDAGDGADTIFGDDAYGGTGGNDAIFGGDGNDTIFGGGYYSYPSDGDDTIDGGDGDDTIYTNYLYDSGTDSIAGGAGNDLFYNVGQGEGIATITGGGGSDTYRIGSGLDAGHSTDVITDFVVGAGGDVLDFAAVAFDGLPSDGNPFVGGYLRLVQDGADTLVQYDRDAGAAGYDFTTVVRLQNVTATQITRDNIAQGYSPDGIGVTIVDDDTGQTLTGTPDGDTITGNGGGDNIYGGGAADTIDAGAGSDYVEGGSGDDTIEGGADDDTLLGDNAYGGVAGNDTIYGGSGNDTVYADGYYGGIGGNDTIYGGDGDDYLRGGYYNPGGDGNDIIYGGDGADTVDVSNGYGDSDTDAVYGGDGDDLITGAGYGPGVATITGGAGSDTYRFYYPGSGYAAGAEADVVTDFATGAGGDKLDFSATPFNGLPGDANPFTNG
ncbi:beta strand repeat-containing protein [Sphingomonas sp.]|uniref:beta strand repeat-containing protein n=1 Tax=Sphingomonas sp. TaxID=28214 RepID=UPI0035BC71DF